MVRGDILHDLAYLEAFPVRTFFTTERLPPRRRKWRGSSASSSERALRASMTRRFGPNTRPTHDPMYRQVGAFRIPVDGVGELSTLAGRKAALDPDAP